MSSPIGGFMPIPLAMMMPFMAAQSMLMGDAFGKGFQFGKRKISAMSNEEFNSLTMSAMVTDMQTEFKNIVPTIQQSIIDSRQVQNVIISEMIKIVPEFLKFMTQTQIIDPVTQGVDELAHIIGTHAGHDTTTSTTTTTPTTTTTIVYEIDVFYEHWDPTRVGVKTQVHYQKSQTEAKRFLQNQRDVINSFNSSSDDWKVKAFVNNVHQLSTAIHTKYGVWM